ncbi:Detected protein of confused Function [Hibiscus syriacus]|uniref:Detected protein of confused Function n=1 Tax=Hibiscus syriacus TaxID=106335 RepID=A0A6A2YKQ1_HIBSY|nr:Detected protein of confused Function [Hibiscus syriacus]
MIAMNKGRLEEILKDLSGRTDDKEPLSPKTEQIHGEKKMGQFSLARVDHVVFPSITGSMKVDSRLQQKQTMEDDKAVMRVDLNFEQGHHHQNQMKIPDALRKRISTYYDTGWRRNHHQLRKMSKDLTKELQDLEERMYGNMQAKDDAIKQFQMLQNEIQESTEELNRIKPLYDNQLKKEENITKGIMEREKQLSILYKKQGRAIQFSSKAVRDKWLQKEIEDLEKKTERDKLQDQRKSLWEKESKLSAEIDKLKSEVEKVEKSLDHATPEVMDYSSLPHFCHKEGSGSSRNSSSNGTIDNCFSLDHTYHRQLYDYIKQEATLIETGRLIKQGSVHVEFPELDPVDAKIAETIESEFQKLADQNGICNSLNGVKVNGD